MSNLFRGCFQNVIFVTVNVLGINRVNWGELPSVLCCARILVCYFGFECKINLFGGLFKWTSSEFGLLGWSTMPG